MNLYRQECIKCRGWYFADTAPRGCETDNDYATRQMFCETCVRYLVARSLPRMRAIRHG